MPLVILPFTIIDFTCHCIVIYTLAVFGVVEEGTLKPISIGIGINPG
jgi:hypothetical protein